MVSRILHYATGALGAALLVAGLLVFTINVVALRAGLNAQNVLDSVQKSQVAADCRAKISGAYNELRDVRDDVSADLQQQLDRALINAQAGTRSTQEDVNLYLATDMKLTQARAAVRALPNVAISYKHGVDINGTHYASCPG